jgi:hypothetical protein
MLLTQISKSSISRIGSGWPNRDKIEIGYFIIITRVALIRVIT